MGRYMGTTFYDQPVLNSPYEEPRLHHALDERGLPTDKPPIERRRPSALLSPIPKSRKQRSSKQDDAQQDLGLHAGDGVSDDSQQYATTTLINEIRAQVSQWRRLPNPNDWRVTPTTRKLLEYWRSHEFQTIRPFFCQVEAVETLIWLTEVADPDRGVYKRFWDQIKSANKEANPELTRLALKMATGAGKTTVMAMIMAWQTINAVRSPGSDKFTRGFLIVTPGITIKDRLRELQPHDPNSYYKMREIVPADMMREMQKAEIVITNYHAFQPREILKTGKVGKSLLQGRGGEIRTVETDGQMLQRVASGLMNIRNIMVLNDEAHHCYREKPGDMGADALKGDEKKEAKKENEAARLWINGIEAFKRKLGVRNVIDLSATPFFLRGSGYAEGTLFPWTVSDFSLLDAIECGIVKLPRVPVADNIPGEDVPVFRNLWDHIVKDMPKKGRSKGGGDADPRDLPQKLMTALQALYNHYEETSEAWEKLGLETPPVFIVVCNNTATSKLVYEWISGWERPNEDGEMVYEHDGHLPLFRNYDEHGNRLSYPNTLLIDSAQLESGDALDTGFRKAAAAEIELFQKERRVRGELGEISESELLREVMNTVGKKGRLGEKVRCVVSVSMLTEGWDASTVTHILGVRAFGTQLLCEQVVGRGLRRYTYELNDEDLFDAEYADIMGIPFDFAASPQVAPPKPPKKSTRIAAVKERAHLEIVFPRVTGYREKLPDEKLMAEFSDDSRMVIHPNDVGPGETLLEGIVGEGVTLTVEQRSEMRRSSLAFELAKVVMNKYFCDENGEPKLHLFGQIKRIVREWVDGYLKPTGGAGIWMIAYPAQAERAAEHIMRAIERGTGDEINVMAVLDPYNPKGSTRFVGFQTTKDTYVTDSKKCHVDHVVLDGDWEAEMARVAEKHPRVIAYVKNQGLGFEVPYRDGSVPRIYIPDFIVLVDDGGDEPLHLIIEIKGYRGEDVKLKSETMKTQWVPGVNNLNKFGRWAFEEFRDVYEISKEFDAVIERAIAKGSGADISVAGALAARGGTEPQLDDIPRRREELDQ